jgi:hypothetical protein
VGQVAAPEPSQVGRWCLELQDVWSLRSPPEKEVGSGAMGRVVVAEPNCAGRWGPDPWDVWWHRSLPEQGGRVRYRGSCGIAWLDALLPALVWSLYTKVPGLQGTDSS